MADIPEVTEQEMMDVVEAFMENLRILFDMADKNPGTDVASALGDISSPKTKVKYQLQLSLVANKKMWMRPEEAQYREAYKVIIGTKPHGEA